MSVRYWISPVTKRLHKIHWHSRLARLGGPTNCMSPWVGHIYVADGDINADTLAHEDGHQIQAIKRGWLYLPWVLWAYVFRGYGHAKAEREADEHLRLHRHRYVGLREGA
jgi:hypothetical protein